MISAEKFQRDLGLTCLVETTKKELNIQSPELNRPGMQFCGFYEYFAFERPQVIGKVEMSYLEKQPAEERRLKEQFRSLGFSALNFTDSRGKYQFYSLDRLWEDLQTARNHGLRLWHAATEPVSAAEIYRHLTGQNFRNELPGIPADYDFRTRHAELFGGQNGYISSAEQVLERIRAFVQAEEKG